MLPSQDRVGEHFEHQRILLLQVLASIVSKDLDERST